MERRDEIYEAEISGLKQKIAWLIVDNHRLKSRVEKAEADLERLKVSLLPTQSDELAG